MFYYRKDNEDGSFEIRSSEIELNELDWYEIPTPKSAYAIWDEETQEWF